MKKISLEQHADRTIHHRRLQLSSPESFSKEEHAEGWEALKQLCQQSFALAERNPLIKFKRPRDRWEYWDEHIDDPDDTEEVTEQL